MSDAPSFLCDTCGQRHPGLPADYGFRLPDEVHALSYIEHYVRTRRNSDFCTLDESRFFIRGVLPLPISGSGEEFCWGIWVEVDRVSHDLCIARWEESSEGLPRFAGKVANTLPPYEATIGLDVKVQMGPAGERPSFYFGSESQHALALEQRRGISRRRQHDILSAVGFFDRKDAV